MAQFSTVFDDYATGAFPSDWTKLIGSDTVTVESGTDGNELYSTALGTGSTVSIWDKTNVNEALFKVRAYSANAGAYVGFHLATASGTTHGFRGYIFRINGTRSPYTTFLQRWDGNSVVNVGASGTVAYDPSTTWYWVRFQRSGTSIKVRFWQHGVVEPGTWNIDAVDNTYTDGDAGISNIYGFRLTSIAIGTDGDAAAMALPAGQYQVSDIGGLELDDSGDAGVNFYNVPLAELEASSEVATVNTLFVSLAALEVDVLSGVEYKTGHVVIAEAELQIESLVPSYRIDVRIGVGSVVGFTAAGYLPSTVPVLVDPGEMEIVGLDATAPVVMMFDGVLKLEAEAYLKDQRFISVDGVLTFECSVVGLEIGRMDIDGKLELQCAATGAVFEPEQAVGNVSLKLECEGNLVADAIKYAQVNGVLKLVMTVETAEYIASAAPELQLNCSSIMRNGVCLR